MPESKEKIIRSSPESIEAEKAVLGCMLIDAESVSKVIHYINASSFSDPNHGIIFSAMLELFDDY